MVAWVPLEQVVSFASEIVVEARQIFDFGVVDLTEVLLEVVDTPTGQW